MFFYQPGNIPKRKFLMSRCEDDKPQVAIDVTPEPSSGGRGSSSLRQRLEDYCRRCLLGDVVAGITVGSVLVPQSMAYALLARWACTHR